MSTDASALKSYKNLLDTYNMLVGNSQVPFDDDVIKEQINKILDSAATTVDGYEEHREKTKNQMKKPYREYIDFSHFSVHSLDNDNKVKIIIYDNNTDEDYTDSLLKKFRAYEIMSCTIRAEVAEILLDKEPDIFNGITLHYIEDDYLDD